jgi:hypothetical protein
MIRVGSGYPHSTTFLLSSRKVLQSLYQYSVYNDRIDQGDGKEQSASCEQNGSVASCSSWGFTSANAQSRSTCGTSARLAPEGKVGRPSCALMLGRSRESGACDFLHLTDLCLRSLFAFFILELKTRKVIHVGVTRSVWIRHIM